MYRLITSLNFIFIGFVIWINVDADNGGRSVFFDIVRHTKDGDKIGHFFLYGILALGCNIALRFRMLGGPPYGVYWGTLLVSIFVITEEFSQRFFPARTVDARDLYADAAGIACFTVLTALIHICVYFYQIKQLRSYSPQSTTLH